MPRYNHAFDIAFEVVTDHEADEVTPEEIVNALMRRIISIQETGEVLEAVGLPFDSYEEEAE